MDVRRWMAGGRPSPQVTSRDRVPLGLRGMHKLLLQGEGFSNLVRLDELHRDQHRPRPEEAYSYPDVHRLAVPVHEHFLRTTDLLTHWIVDRVTGAPALTSLPVARDHRGGIGRRAGRHWSGREVRDLLEFHGFSFTTSESYAPGA